MAQVSVCAVGQLVGGRDRPRRRLRRDRHPPAGPPQRVDRRQAGRPARNRQLRPRRPLSLRSAVRAGDLEPGDRRGAGPGAGQPRSVAAPAGEMPVVLGPGWCGVLLHEAVGHGLEGDFNRKGTSAFSGRIGERVAAPGVTVVDEGAIDDRRGSLTHRRRRHADRPHRADRGRHPQRLSAGPAERPADGHGADRQRPPRKLRPCADAAHDQHLHARRHGRSGRTDQPGQERHLRQELRRRAGRHHQRQVRLLLHRGLSHRGRQARRPDQGRDADRRRAERADPGQGHRQRHGAGRRRRHVRQGRPVDPGRRRPADPADRRADGRRDRCVSLVALATYGTRVEADLDRLALEAEGIDAIIFDAEANSFFGGGGLISVRLMVLDEDLERAVQILRERSLPSLSASARPARGRTRPDWPGDSVPRVGTPSSLLATAQARVERLPDRQKANSLPSPAACIASRIASMSDGPRPRAIGTWR